MPAATCPYRSPLRRPAAPGTTLALLTLALLMLAGCGAEVAGTAAAVGKLQAEQASQARAQQQQVIEGMKQAQDAGLQRAADAAASAGQ